MPSIKTEITEIVTGLGMMGFSDLPRALASRPSRLMNVDPEVWARLTEAFATSQYPNEFQSAWSNGAAFLEGEYGLRNRLPIRVEWKGSHQAPAYEMIPADLRVDHVYLISCKYLSKVLFNAAPGHLFDRLLRGRTAGSRADWFQVTAPELYQTLYDATRSQIHGSIELPHQVSQLTKPHREFLTTTLKGAWSSSARVLYQEMCATVSDASAAHWNANLPTLRAREEMLWRLLRLASAPYFVLGTSGKQILRIRVYTPWDWRNEFSLDGFDIWPDISAGQAVVRWRARVKRNDSGEPIEVLGHVEIRWSHGRFCGNPEAKVYLDTGHDQVPGYAPL